MVIKRFSDCFLLVKVMKKVASSSRSWLPCRRLKGCALLKERGQLGTQAFSSKTIPSLLTVLNRQLLSSFTKATGLIVLRVISSFRYRLGDDWAVLS
jgi:hypothetical protein